MLFHADTFARYGAGPDTSLMLNGLWAQVVAGGLYGDPDGVTADRTIAFGGGTNQNGYARFVCPNLNATSGIANRLWVDALSSDPTNNSAQPMIWWDDLGNKLFDVRFTASGRAQLYQGNTLLGTSTNPVITANAWWHLEAKLVFSVGGTGTFELRREGVPVLTVSGITSAAYPYSVGIGALRSGVSGGVAAFYKDLALWDGTGTYNHDFLGSVVAYDLLTDSDVTLGGWTSTDANGWSVLDNNPPDPAHYLAAAYPVPTACEFTFTDLPANITSVKGLITRVRAAKVDGGDGNLQVSVKHSGFAQTGANRPITVAQTYYQDVFEVDPSTSAPWVPLGVAAMTATLDRTV